MSTHTAHDSSLDAALSADLASLRDRDLERQLRTIRERRGAVVTTDAGVAIDFASNDYLGLATDPRLIAAASSAAAAGASASRLIVGNTAEHDALDTTLADFFGTESALSFSTGYAANVGVISALVGRGDAIFADGLNHASLIDGCRLSRADVYVYPHVDVATLAALLEKHRASHRRALIVTDGMFSMDGDFAPLGDVVSLARAYEAWTYVDDAHAVGVLGANGRGITELPGVASASGVDVLAGTLGKAFGVAGAFIAGSRVLRDFLVNRARSFVFSTGPTPLQAAAGREALRIVAHEPERRARSSENARRLRAALREQGIDVTGESDSHIIPVVIGGAARTMRVGETLAGCGFLVGAVRPPTVPDGTSRLRVTASAAHTTEQIEAFARTLAEVLRMVAHA